MGLDGGMNASLVEKELNTSEIIDGINNNLSMIQPQGNGDVMNINNSVVDLIES